MLVAPARTADARDNRASRDAQNFRFPHFARVNSRWHAP